MERFLKGMNWATLFIEVLVAVALVALAGGALLALGSEMYNFATSGTLLTPVEFTKIISTVLEIFILVELFRIAIAYMKHENVVPTVLEAALVAVARKFVVFEAGSNYLQTAIGLSALLLAVSVSWWMLSRSNACDIADH
ncbi:MAG: phosphate-starvation-inducible PsiE family protein [Coriobacteriia bacterium]|nr:phosphate-starvation-inducible PsiE family protein [Coriobacteriia bacterium]